MKASFPWAYRAFLVFLAVWLGGAFGATAQSPDPAPEVVVTVEGTNGVRGVVALEPQRVLTFGLDRVEWLQFQVMGFPLWQYFASLIYIFLAFLVSRFLDYFIAHYLKKLAARTATTFDDLLLGLVHGPVKVISFVILLHIGLQIFTWPFWLEEAISKALKLAVAVSLTYVTLKFIDLVMSYWKQRTGGEADQTFDEQLFPIVRKSLKVFILVVAVLVTSQNLGLNITSLIASLSIGGLALGLAAQDTLGNFFGAVAVFLDKPFRLGDRIQLDAVDGVVEAIGMRSTRVRNLDGHLITIPNKTMGNATIINITRRPNIKTVMNIGITYDTPADKAQRAAEILNEVYRQHPMTFDVWISFNKFADFSLNILVIHWWNSTVYKDYLDGMQALNLTIKRRFDEEKISFAFPTQTLYMKQDSDWRIHGESSPPKILS